MQVRTIAGRLARNTMLAATLAAAGLVQGGQPAAPPGAAAAAPLDTRTQAWNILWRMAHFLSTAPAFSVTVLSSYDAVQASGQKIEFGERRKLVLNRPDRLRVETEHSDGARSGVVFTGSEIMLVDITNKVYATEPQPKGLDDSIVHFMTNLGLRMPLAVLLMQRLPAEFEKRVREIDYVEKTNLMGAPSHHLAVRGDTVDMQVWVTDGAQPLPLRIVLTYKLEPGQPEFRAQFVDWNMAPMITDATFKPEIPAGTHKILFAAQIAAAAARTRSQGGKPEGEGK
jgi:hypothetical protein